MKITEIYSKGPGSRFLVACARKAQEEMLDAALSAMPNDFKARARLNTANVASMDILPDEHPNRFSDLLGLCGKLVTMAGKRSHFEGLLLLNIAQLTPCPDNVPRLKALGELLAMPDGLASECVTLLYGPEKENALLSYADQLDFDGRLRILHYERPERMALTELLLKSKLRCDTLATLRQLDSTLKELADAPSFSAEKFLRGCVDGHGLITEAALSEALDDPYSYINRARRAAGIRGRDDGERRIGFQAAC